MRNCLAGLSFAGLLLNGCGGGPQASVTLSPVFGRTWTGDLTVCVAYSASPGCGQVGPFSQAFTLSVDANALTVTGACPDGSGTIVMDGSGSDPEFAEWFGNLQCPASFGLGGIALDYSSMSFRLSDRGPRLTVDGQGREGNADGTPNPFAAAFYSEFAGY